MPFAKINDKSIFYTDDAQKEGSSSKTTTVFVHGLGSSSCFYKTIIPHLQSVSRCITLDTPGSGLSELGKSEQSIQSISSDIIRLLDHLKVDERVVIVGHSMGGIVASEVAATYPDRVKGVVLIGPVNPQPQMATVFEQRIEAVKKDGLEGLAGSIPTAATGKKSTSLHHAFVRSLILGTSPEGYMSLCRVISTAKQPKYDAVTAPLVILAGEDDKTAPLESSETILENYGTDQNNKSIQRLSGVGHWHCIEAADEVARHIEQFVKNIS